MYVLLIIVCPFVLFSFGHCVVCSSTVDIRFLIAPLVSSNSSKVIFIKCQGHTDSVYIIKIKFK